MIQECVTEPELSNVFNGRYFVANLWHPIKGPNQDWPLALCDLSSLNPDQDLEVADYVSPTSSREHCMVYARNAHRWWYLSNQKTTESFLFRQHDSSKGKTSGKQTLSTTRTTFGISISCYLHSGFARCSPCCILEPVLRAGDAERESRVYFACLLSVMNT